MIGRLFLRHTNAHNILSNLIIFKQITLAYHRAKTYNQFAVVDAISGKTCLIIIPRGALMEKRRSGYIILIIIILCILLVVVAAVLSGIGKAKGSSGPQDTAEASVSPPAATPTPTPTQTPAPTPTPTSSATPLANDGVPGLAEKSPAEDAFFSDSVFVGNSLVDGLYLYGGVSTCRWLSGTGVSLYNIDKQSVSDKIGGNCTVTEGLSRQQYGKVYIELGINEISMSAKDFSKSYSGFIDQVRTLQPSADIYVLSLTPVSAKKSAGGGYFTQANVKAFNSVLYNLCVEKNCWYLDSYTPLADAKGYLPGDATSDGIHFNPSYYSKWMDVIRTHYV